MKINNIIPTNSKVASSKASLLKENRYKTFFNSKKLQLNQENLSKNNNVKVEMSNLSSLNSKNNFSISSSYSNFEELEYSNIKSELVGSMSKEIKKVQCKNNNNNIDGYRHTLSDTYLYRKTPEALKKNSKSLEKLYAVKKKSSNANRNQIEIEDRLLKELNKNFECLIDESNADACISMYYFEKLHSILLMFHSLINTSDIKLENVNVIIDVYDKETFKKRLISKLKPLVIDANAERLFKHSFLIKINKKMDIKTVILNVYIIGNKVNINRFSSGLNEISKQFLLFSKTSSSDKQILGGAHIVIKKFL